MSDLLADRALRDTKLVCRAGETLQTSHGLEGDKCVERRHVPKTSNHFDTREVCRKGMAVCAVFVRVVRLLTLALGNSSEVNHDAQSNSPCRNGWRNMGRGNRYSVADSRCSSGGHQLCAVLLYGLFAAALALPRARQLLARLNRRDVLLLLELALTGNVVYFILLSAAVQFAESPSRH